MELLTLSTASSGGVELFPSGRRLLAKTLLIMRLTTIFLLATALQISAKGLSQKVSISGRNLPLEKVFTTIEEQTGYSFVYKYNDLRQAQPVDLHLKNADLRTVLDACLREQHLTYTIEKNIIAIRAVQDEPVMPAATEAPMATITGTVKNDTGELLAGVTVLVRGTKRNTLTNDKGEFTIPANAGEVLVFSYVGYSNKEVTVGSEQNLDVTMIPADSNLGAVVITALGIRRSEKSLTYANQQVSGDELTTVKTDNLMNTLNGKVAGVTIAPSASGVGGSVKVLLRGNRSASGNNQPLYVIDGIPISNTSNGNAQPTNTFGGTPDGGDGISNLNPEDIASISVLEGASAAALYGSQAENGVILITTKRGKAGKATVNASSSFTAQQTAYRPRFQSSYGRTSPSAVDSWGSSISGSPDNLKQFFQTGTNWTNAVSISGGTTSAQTYFSYANTAATGVEPDNKLGRNNFTVRETAKALDNKLTIDANVNYISQKIHNSPALGIYSNPLTGLYLFPRGMDIAPYKQRYLDPNATGGARQIWPIADQSLYTQNPWWTINKQPSNADRDRLLFNGSLRYDVTPWLYVQLRGNVDRIADTYESDYYSGTNKFYNSNGNGHMQINDQTSTQKYGDLIVNFNPAAHSDFKVDGFIGGSITDNKATGVYGNADLATPDFFSISNMIASLPRLTTLTTSPVTDYVPSAGAFNSPYPVHSQIQALFASANLSYKDWLYLALTARNDWSSNLSFTPNDSYFYPSAGLSVILSQLLHMPEWVSYAKVRGSYADVGNTVPPYLTFIQNSVNSAGQLVFNTANAFRTLKPEKTHSTEVGTEWRFFDNRLNFTFTWYKTNTLNQYFPIQPVVASLLSTGYVNAGNIQNDGIEFTLGYEVIKNRKFTWNTAFNGAMNRNKVIELDTKDSITTFLLTGNYNNAYQSELVKGGEYGDIYGYTLQKNAKGQVLFSGNGTTTPYAPEVNSKFGNIGNPMPRFQLGWRNDFTMGNWNLGFLVDGKFGGHVLSLTQAILDQYGVSKVTGEARNAGGVKVNGVDANGNAVTSVTAQSWYEAIGGRGGATGEYMYGATVVRLREASLGYLLPIPQGFFHSVKVSLIGRNLAYFSKKAPFDPELTMSTGNGLSGVDVFNQPAMRNMGLSINASF
jgi:TonB-linked SusC/RagA family outer membrane protein